MNKFLVIKFILFCTLFFGCKSLKNYPNIENYNYLKKEIVSDYELLSYSSSNDTILIVLKKELLSKCVKLNISKTDLKNIKRIDKIDPNIGFYYKTNTTEGMGIITGSFEPGQNGIIKIYSYDGMPYLIENCSEIK